MPGEEQKSMDAIVVGEEQVMDTCGERSSLERAQQPRLSTASYSDADAKAAKQAGPSSSSNTSLNANDEPAEKRMPHAFFEAVKNGALTTLSSFLSPSANPPVDLELETHDGFTPLVIAILQNHIAAAHLLLSHGASPHHRVNRLPPLVHAALSRDHGPAFMQLLLSHGAIVTGISGPDVKTALHWAAGAGLASSVDFLARQTGVDVDARCMGDRTAMIVAAQEGHESVVKVLWAHGADALAKAEHGGTALGWAACTGSVGVARFLIEKGVDLEERDHIGNTALLLASNFGHADVVDLLIAAGAEVNVRSEDSKACTPLMAATWNNEAAVVKSLLAHGAHIRATAPSGEDVFGAALLQGSRDVINILLETVAGEAYPKESVALQFAMAKDHATMISLIATASAMYSHIELQPSEPNKHAWIDWVLEQGGDLVAPLAKMKILHAAVKERDIDMVKCLTLPGCDVNSSLGSGMTPLAFAVFHRDCDLVKVLLKAGADPNQAVCMSGKPGDPEITPFNYAIMNIWDNVDMEIVDLLLDSARCRINQGVDLKSTAFSFVLAKCKKPESQEVAAKLAKRMIETIPDVDADRDDNGFTPLHVATHHRNLSMVTFLLSQGADIEATADDGTTPFFLACQRDPMFAQELLARGANPKIRRNKTNASALHAMAAQGQNNFPLYEEVGLDINEQTLKGYTPLACALRWGHEATALMLMENGAHVKWKTNRNQTALHFAGRNGLHKAMEKILEQDIDVNAVDTKGWTSLHEACATGTTAVVTQLLDAGADIERPLPDKDTPLHVALNSKKEDIALLLLERGADVSAIASRDRSPLHLAAEANLLRATEALLKLAGGAMIEATDEETWTPLCCTGSPEIVKMLIKAGADIHYANKNGWTPLHQAVLNGDAEAAWVLVEAGASLDARTTDDGLTVEERAVDMWNWSRKPRQLPPRLLDLALARRKEGQPKDSAEPSAEEDPEGLGGDFEVVNASD